MKFFLSPGTLAIMDLSLLGNILSDIVGVAGLYDVPKCVSLERGCDGGVELVA